MDWIKEMEEKYATLSSADIFNFLLDYINFQETLSPYDEVRRSIILDEIEKRMGCT